MLLGVLSDVHGNPTALATWSPSAPSPRPRSTGSPPFPA
jgi:hypothetical protein